MFVAAGLAFISLGVLRFVSHWDQLSFGIYGSVLILLLLKDLRSWRIPPLLGFASIMLGILFGEPSVAADLLDRILGAVFGFLFMWLALVAFTGLLRLTSYLRHDEFAIGPGDALVFGAIGAFVGYIPLAKILFLASLQGIFAYFILKFDRRAAADRTTLGLHLQSVPFGTFLCLSALEFAVWPSLPSQLSGIIRSLI